MLGGIHTSYILHDLNDRWHPYIPPFGFSRCAVCTCKVRYMFYEDVADDGNDDDCGDGDGDGDG